ncbi:MAG: hypothetical protein CTY29_05640 [Methylobacter sp.]|nr:MAG: hypothetical protein CTY29_05640 [Methylobacter sp.]PPD16998.1 MAG: hypothetical protein CTY24_15670 [Methylobacter sp.]
MHGLNGRWSAQGLPVACLLLAVLPDADFLFWRFLPINPEPRFKHRLAFANTLKRLKRTCFQKVRLDNL